MPAGARRAAVPRVSGGGRQDGGFFAVDGSGGFVGHHFDLFGPGADDWRRLWQGRAVPTHVRSVVVDAPRCGSAQRYAWIPLPTDPALPR